MGISEIYKAWKDKKRQKQYEKQEEAEYVNTPRFVGFVKKKALKNPKDKGFRVE